MVRERSRGLLNRWEVKGMLPRILETFQFLLQPFVLTLQLWVSQNSFHHYLFPLGEVMLKSRLAEEKEDVCKTPTSTSWN